MLSKLIKYEWKALFKQNTIIFFTLLLATLFASIVLIISGNTGHYSTAALFPTLFLYYLLLISVPIATLIIFAMRFYRSCYGSEGYLTNTLPVKSSKIILSKVIVGSINVFIMTIFVLLSIFTVIISFLAFSKDLQLDEITLSLSNIPSFKELTNISFPIFIIIMLISLILSSLSSVNMVIGSISFGHLWQKHKILGSIVSYVGIYFVMQFVSFIFIMPATTKLSMSLINTSDPLLFMQGYSKLMLIYIPSMALIVSVSLYLISNYILKKKINLD